MVTAAPPVEIPEPVAAVEPAVPAPVAEIAASVAETTLGIGPLEDRAAELLEEPVAAPPIEPVATAPVVPPVAAPFVMPPELQQHITGLENRLAEQDYIARQQTDAKTLQDATTQHAQGLAQEAVAMLAQLGMEVTAEQVLPFVQKIAQQQLGMAYQQYQAERSRKGQTNAAFALGQRHGVDPRILMDLPTEEAMMKAIEQATASGKRDTEIADLKAQVAKLTKAQIPAQSFASGAAGPALSRGRQGILDRYVNGEPITAAEKKFLFPDR